jgi:putative zinc finger/helix-turn-helix YgiT family protein
MKHESPKNEPRRLADKPFPWRCGNCLKDEVSPETMPYATDIKHDGRLYHLEIPAIAIPKCQACGEVVFSNSVDEEVLLALRAHLHLLTPQQIKKGRKTLGLKAKELAERIGVAAETISRWEKGYLIQSRLADNALRTYFAVPEVRNVLRGAKQDPKLGVPPTLEKRDPLETEFRQLSTAKAESYRRDRDRLLKSLNFAECN